MAQDPSLADRLVSLWDHLGLRAAHVAAQLPSDLGGFVARHPERIAGLLLCEATSIDPAPFAALAPRMTLVAGDGGISARVADTAAAQLAPGSLDNGLRYAARLKVCSSQAARASSGLRWPFFSISHSAL